MEHTNHRNKHFDKSIEQQYTILALITAAVCMLVGVGIYASAREHILFLEWIGWHGKPCTSTSVWTDWVIYSLPDGLWYLALLLTMDVLRRKASTSKLGRALSTTMMAIAILLPYTLEYAQHLHIIDGTYDRLDILTYCLTLFLFYICKTNSLFLSCFK